LGAGALGGAAVIDVALRGGRGPFSESVTLAGGLARTQAAAAAARNARIVRPDDPRLAFIGQWNVTRTAAITVNSGSRLLFRFTGRTLCAAFDVAMITNPPQIWVTIDGGAPALYSVQDAMLDLTPTPLDPGEHHVELDTKDVDQLADRWVPPLRSALILTGFALDSGARLLDAPYVGPHHMAFYGDSITEGSHALSHDSSPSGADGTKDYAFLTPLAFGAASAQVGFGNQGIFHAGNGEVPNAPRAFGWIYQGVRNDPRFTPDVVVINQGTNDTTVPASEFSNGYADYLRQFILAYPHALVFALRTFGGYQAAATEAAVKGLANARVHYVDTSGWLGPGDYTDGIHPTVAGHAKVTARLVPIIARHTGWRVVRTT
jgi:lysophospholipase L1-like esterase